MTALKVAPSLQEAKLAFSSDAYNIGSGCFREVNRVFGSYWAYKFDAYDYGHNLGGNKSEWEYYRKLQNRQLSSYIKIPEMQLLDDSKYLAVQYIEGLFPSEQYCSPGYHDCGSHHQQSCFWTIYGDELSSIVDDLHSGNVKISLSGDIYLIDLGGGC